MKNNHPTLLALHFRSTVNDVQAAITAAGAPSYHYPKDEHFENFVLRNIHTVRQAKAVVATLNADCHAMGYDHDCQKASGLKNLARDAKRFPSISIGVRCLLAMRRRTHCGCHNVGDFALSKRYHEAIAAQQSK